MNVIAIIVTHDPELDRFGLVLNQASRQVNHVIVVDNDSSNKNIIRDLCNRIGNCDFIEVGFNSGVAHSLRVGVNYAGKYNPDWLLFLDDDTVLMNNVMSKIFHLISDLPIFILDRIGALLLTSSDGNYSISEARYGSFSGTLIRANIAARVCCRDDFFLDQADNDMYSKIRELNYYVLNIRCKLIDHKLGIKRLIPVISDISHKSTSYEPPWRYYYITRNSTRLLIEGKMDFASYILLLADWGIKVLFADGPWALIKPLGLGITHALLNELGYVDPRFFV